MMYKLIVFYYKSLEKSKSVAPLFEGNDADEKLDVFVIYVAGDSSEREKGS